MSENVSWSHHGPSWGRGAQDPLGTSSDLAITTSPTETRSRSPQVAADVAAVGY